MNLSLFFSDVPLISSIIGLSPSPSSSLVSGVSTASYCLRAVALFYFYISRPEVKVVGIVMLFAIRLESKIRALPVRIQDELCNLYNNMDYSL